jgi:very-short-patch-repair endonuclease
MGPTKLRSREIWSLVARQHGAIARWQLLKLGMSAQAIRHRIATRRLHRVYRGVYAVGRRELTPLGRWMAGLLACGPSAVLSHSSAAALWRISAERNGVIEVSVPEGTFRRRAGLLIHRRTAGSAADLTTKHNIPVTSPVRTLIDLATCMSRDQLEAAINEADKRDRVDPETLRASLEASAGMPGAAKLRRVLDQRTFTLTDSELERRFVPIARKAGLPLPQTQAHVNGFRVDFYWPELGLVVETDGLRYHRTPADQAKDKVRDQTHLAAGLTPLRFTRAQVRYEPGYVEKILAEVAKRVGTGIGLRTSP